MKNVLNLEYVPFSHNKKKRKTENLFLLIWKLLGIMNIISVCRNAACCSAARPFYSKLYIAGPATFYSAARHHYSSEILHSRLKRAASFRKRTCFNHGWCKHVTIKVYFLRCQKIFLHFFHCTLMLVTKWGLWYTVATFFSFDHVFDI